MSDRYGSNMNSSTSADNRREQAIALRRAGKSRREIKEILGVGSNGSILSYGDFGRDVCFA